MNQCLRCNTPQLETSPFCKSCREALLNRSYEKKRLLLPNSPTSELTATLGVIVPHFHRRPVLKRLRISFIALTVLAVLALIVDGILVWRLAMYPRPEREEQDKSLTATGAPIMMITTDRVTPGRSVLLHIWHATPKAWLYITRDRQVPIQFNQGNGLVQAGAYGQVDINMLVGNDWTAGIHNIYAEDMQTRRIAKTMLQVEGGKIALDRTHIDTNIPVLAKNTALVITPPLLLFTAIDGGMEPAQQYVKVHNSSKQPVRWSLASEIAKLPTGQHIPYSFVKDWIKIEPTNGEIAPGETITIALQVHSRTFLSGLYKGKLKLKSEQAGTHNVQEIVVALDVQPPCGVNIQMDRLSFAIVKHAYKPESQKLAVSTTKACAKAIKWQTSSFVDWLTVTPNGGEIREKSTMTATVSVATDGLLPGLHSGWLVLLTEQQTQTVPVRLVTTQPSLSTSIPAGATHPTEQLTGTVASSSPGGTLTPTAERLILEVSPPQLAFTALQGVAYTPGKSIAVTNTSRGPLSWSIASKIPSWLNIAHTEASLAAGESTQIPVSVDTAWLQPGSYDAHITITATDSTGTPVLESSQEVLVQLKVEPLCSLQVKPSSLTFYDTMSNSHIKQEITIKRTGYCTQPVIWTASAAQKQIILSSSNGHDNGRGSIVAVSINKTGKGGVYMGKIIITARGRDGTAVLDSPQVVEVRIMRDQR